MQTFHERLLSQSPVINPGLLKKMLALEIEKLDEQSIPSSKTKWHERRIEMRKLQYRLEILGMHSPKLKDLQRSIGRAHDLHILCDYFPEDVRIKKEENKALTNAKQKYHKDLRAVSRSLKQNRAS
jgi:CHAD domain-containing protein